MSASTTFKPSIRDAGELNDHRLYGSFRSLHRFDAPIHKSKHEDIFKSKEFESTIIPIPPKPHSAINEPTNERQLKEKNSSKERTSSGRRSKRSSGEDSKKSRHRHKKTEKDKEEEEKKDAEFLKYLGERHERRRKKHTNDEQINQDTNNNNKENANDHVPVSLRRINSSKERINHRGVDVSEEQNGEKKLQQKLETKQERTRSDRTKFITKTNAFNESEDSDSDNKDEGNNNNNDDDVKVEIQKTGLKNDMKINQNSDYLKLIQNFNTMNFLLTPAPHGQTIMCKIMCRRGLINEYHFYLEQSDCANILLLKTQRKMTSAKPSHLINIVNYNENGQKILNEISCAKVSSNIARKKFKLNLDTTSFPSLESNILNVIFKSNSGEPRKVIATACLCSGTNVSKDKVTYFLKNRQPYYDVNMRKFVLNYNGRAKQSSKNNFQIVDESLPDEILMQLGKVETGEYNCDFAWPLCAMQAFGLALASLSR